MNETIVATSLGKTYPSTGRGAPPIPVLSNVSLRVADGEMVAIVGPSGSGKSTLLYCLAGLEPVTSGQVQVLGADLQARGRRDSAALRLDSIGFVFQAFNLIPSLSMRENVALPARLAKRPVERAAIDAMLADVGLADQARKLPAQLSGGQQQRVAIARVLAAKPSIVFADEPTGSLDSVTGREVLRLLRELAVGPGAASVVLVTHDLDAAAAADRVLVMRDGSIIRELHDATARDILDAVESGTGASLAAGVTPAVSARPAVTRPTAASSPRIGTAAGA
ncbi:ABC transporter ATP-binding protein [Plantibacter sp. Mn2098]|uniref:ABC transporter ATP-binding protein n=1 Tax=Plantibacter sp. Mn2098 TaxID=3395266 RepID=UPI003BC3BA21